MTGAEPPTRSSNEPAPCSDCSADDEDLRFRSLPSKDPEEALAAEQRAALGEVSAAVEAWLAVALDDPDDLDAQEVARVRLEQARTTARQLKVLETLIARREAFRGD